MDEPERTRMDDLLDESVSLARFLLEKSGEFFPTCCVIKGEGKIEYLATYDGDEHPPSNKVIADLISALQAMARSGELAASAIVADIRWREREEDSPRDAISVQLRAAGYACDVVVPYTIRKAGLFGHKRTVDLGQPRAWQAEQNIFV